MKNIARALEIKRRYTCGETQQNIGESFNISRERVRQILFKQGINGESGGKKISYAKELEERHSKYINTWLPNYKCTRREFREINGGAVLKSGTGSLGYKYSQQRQNSKKRGIPFLLTFPEWHNIWVQSGQVNNIGIGMGQYCMTRKGDAGPYSMLNVEIKTVSDNHKDAWEYKKWTPRKKKC